MRLNIVEWSIDMAETLKDNIWYPELVMKDLVEAGLSPKALGYDITNLQGQRFFYNKVPFAIVGWAKNDFMILAFGAEFPEYEMKEIVKTFRKVLEYPPFIQYKIHQNNEKFTIFEWAKEDESGKLIDIMALSTVMDLHKIKDEYYNV